MLQTSSGTGAASVSRSILYDVWCGRTFVDIIARIFSGSSVMIISLPIMRSSTVRPGTFRNSWVSSKNSWDKTRRTILMARSRPSTTSALMQRREPQVHPRVPMICYLLEPSRGQLELESLGVQVAGASRGWQTRCEPPRKESRSP
jgi:hypothetical protein